MAKFALLVALVALGVAVLAYQEAGGTKDLARRLDALKQESVEGLGKLRQETADGLSKVERALRSDDTAKAKPKP
jgi:hypothetical protein